MLKTPVAAEHLSVPYHRLVNLIRYGKIQRPMRDSSGDYLWSPTDIAAARHAIRAIDEQRHHAGASA